MKRSTAVVTLLLSGAVFAGAIKLWHATDERAPVPVPVRLGASDSEVALVGDVSHPTVEEGDSVRFWVTVQNRSAVPLRDVRLLTGDLPGFELTSGCWCPRQGPTCIPLAANVVEVPPQTHPRSPGGCEQIIPELAAGQTLTVWGDLRAIRSHPPSVVSVVIRWTPGDRATSQAAIPLGSVEVRTRAVDILFSVRQFAKDFGLSLTLAVLGFLFTLWEKERQNRQQEAEKAREAVQRESDKEREQVIQTWNTMLPVSHALNTEFYIKILRPVRYLVKYTEFWLAAKTEPEAGKQKLRAFYGWALMRRHIRNLQEQSGYYFKDRTGEMLANYCGLAAVEHFDAACGEDGALRLHKLMEHVELTEKRAAFVAKLDDANQPERQAVFQACLGDFETWRESDGFLSALLCLKGLSAVLNYEINRPYQYWYGSSEKLEVDNETRKRLVDLAKEQVKRNAASEGLVAAVDQYLYEGTGQARAQG